MLQFLFNDILNTCHLLLGLLILIATHWTIQTIKEFQVPGSKKKQKKDLAPCLTSLQGSRNKGTDPERSSEDLNLMYALCTMDTNIQYIAWQMQRITGRTARSSASNTSVETVVSVQTSTHSSAGSWSRTPPSPVPATLGRDVQSWKRQQHLTRPPGAGFQQVRIESRSHRKVDFNIRKKQLKEQWGGPTPHSESLTRLIPPAPALHTAITDPSMQIRTARILSYKEQELLNRHIQKKHQQEEAPLLHLAPIAVRTLTGHDKPQAGGTVHWVIQQSRSHTPPQSNAQGRHTPPKSPRVQSAGPWPPEPFLPPQEQPPPPMLICKTESHSKVSESVQVKVSGGTPKEELAEMLTMLGQCKTPKEKEEDRHSPGRRPGSPKEDLSRVGRAGSPKNKQAEVKVSLRKDQTFHTLSWSNLPEIQRPSPALEPPAAAQPKFLDPSFMCQNQLELPCVAAAQGEQSQKRYSFAEHYPRPPAGTPKPLCLAHTIMQSLDTEQAMRDLQMHLAKGLETGHREPSVEYPLCLLCGRCTPYCPHPRTRYSPCLLVYPRLDVRDGEAYMTLGFLLKIKRSEADEWGLTQGRDVFQTPYSKERPSKKEKSRRTTPRRKSQPLAAGPRPRPQELRIPEKTLPVVGKLFPDSADRNARSPVATRRASRVTATTPAPATPQTPRTQSHPPARRPPAPPPRPPKTPAQSPKTPAQQVPPKTPAKPPSILKQLVSSIKRFWAKVRREAEKCPEKCSETFSPKKSSPSKKPGTPLSAPVSPESRKESGPLSLQSPTSAARVKGNISTSTPASPSLTRKQKASPSKSPIPQTSPKLGTPVTKRTASAKRISPRERKSLQFK